MSLAMLDEDEEILDEDCEQERGLLCQFPLLEHHLATLSPEARQMLRLPPLEPAKETVKPVPAERLETLREVPGASQDQTPKPWRSSVQFVEETSEEISWLIPGVLPAGAVVLLSGREGTMKSFLALSMAHAVASGTPWLGRPTKQGPALYCDGEMPKAFMQERLRGFGTVQDLHIWSWTDPEFPSQLDSPVLQQAAQEHSLIVIDTLRRHMDGLKENSADDMAQITKKLRELTRYGATVLVLHHAPKDIDKQDYRGSTELGAGVDVTFTLTMRPTKSGAVLTLSSGKTRVSSRDRLEIEATEGARVPEFRLVTTKAGTETTGEKLLLALARLIEELRQTNKRDPFQSEVVKEAQKRKLGGKNKILKLLAEGEGKYWVAMHIGNGKPVSYTGVPLPSPGAMP
jgi:archaellum biogenesis ATPase FlaH